MLEVFSVKTFDISWTKMFSNFSSPYLGHTYTLCSSIEAGTSFKRHRPECFARAGSNLSKRVRAGLQKGRILAIWQIEIERVTSTSCLWVFVCWVTPGMRLQKTLRFRTPKHDEAFPKRLTSTGTPATRGAAWTLPSGGLLLPAGPRAGPGTSHRPQPCEPPPLIGNSEMGDMICMHTHTYIDIYIYVHIYVLYLCVCLAVGQT